VEDVMNSCYGWWQVKLKSHSPTFLKDWKWSDVVRC
jgi:hypothetical protein